MKKSILTTSITVILMGATQAVYAVTPRPPVLITPDNKIPISKDKLSIFEWLEPSNAVEAKITNYRFVITTNAKFSDFSQNQKKCIKNTCFTTLVNGTKLPLSTKLKNYLTAGKQYFWRVQALNKGGQSKFDGNGNSFDLVESTLSISAATVNPLSAPAGSSFTFTATLSTALPAGYSVKIDSGDGEFKPMTQSDKKAVSFTYTATIDAEEETGLKAFEIALFDKNNAQIEANGSVISGSYDVLENGADVVSAPIVDTPVEEKPVVIETPPVVVKPVEPVVKPVTVPSVSTINVSPASIVQGDSLTFSANLSDVLPSGYNVKVDYGNGLFVMNGSGKSYSFNAAPATSAAYSIGVYDAKNLLKGTKQTGNFSVSAPKPANVAPTLSLISGDKTATVGVPYTIKLSANDSDGNLSAILVSNWGDGASDSPQTATNGATLSFSHTFTTAGSYTFNAAAYDSADANSNVVSQTVTVSKPAPVVVAPPVTTTKTTGYTKIANNGSVLSDDAKLGANSTDWACTKDNKTGLIWEVKTTDGGLRDKDWRYSWYKPEGDNGGDAGSQRDYEYGGWCKGSGCDTYAFTNAVNAQGLCGANDWRMPTNEELRGLVFCSDGTKTLGKEEFGYICTGSPTNPTINTTYFPNTKSDYFWSSSPYASGSAGAWLVDFSVGFDSWNFKNEGYSVRLVRG
jgi:hypothetical protein